MKERRTEVNADSQSGISERPGIFFRLSNWIILVVFEDNFDVRESHIFKINVSHI